MLKERLVKRTRSAAEQNFSSMRMASILEPTCTVDVHDHRRVLLDKAIQTRDKATPSLRPTPSLRVALYQVVARLKAARLKATGLVLLALRGEHKPRVNVLGEISESHWTLIL